MHRFVGVVVKTFPGRAKVLVERHFVHPKVPKVICRRDEFDVVDGEEETVIGDTVAIEQIAQPISSIPPIEKSPNPPKYLRAESKSKFPTREKAKISIDSENLQGATFKLTSILKQARMYKVSRFRKGIYLIVDFKQLPLETGREQMN